MKERRHRIAVGYDVRWCCQDGRVCEMVRRAGRAALAVQSRREQVREVRSGDGQAVVPAADGEREGRAATASEETWRWAGVVDRQTEGQGKAGGGTQEVGPRGGFNGSGAAACGKAPISRPWAHRRPVDDNAEQAN